MMGLRLRGIVVVLAVLVLGAAACTGSGAGRSGEQPAGQPGSGQTRTVQHAMGTTRVPANPQRVVVLDTGELDAVTTLGITPVGAVTTSAISGFPDYLANKAQGATVVGTIDRPNLEKIAALNPDLILSNKLRHEAIHDELSKIAPTVFAETVGVSWKKNFLLDARALGMRDKARRLLARYEQRANQLGTQVGDPGKVTVSMVRFMPSEIRLYSTNSFVGTVLDDVGFARPKVQRAEGTFVEISREQISKAGGDVIFTSSYGPRNDTAMGAVTSGGLWQQLDAVQAGKIQTVPDDYWMLGIGLGAAQVVLDDLEKYFG